MSISNYCIFFLCSTFIFKSSMVDWINFFSLVCLVLVLPCFYVLSSSWGLTSQIILFFSIVTFNSVHSILWPLIMSSKNHYLFQNVCLWIWIHNPRSFLSNSFFKHSFSFVNEGEICWLVNWGCCYPPPIFKSYRRHALPLLVVSYVFLYCNKFINSHIVEGVAWTLKKFLFF